MKYNAIVLLLIYPSSQAFSQVEFPRNKESGQVEFSKIIQTDSSAKKDNFNNSKVWVVDVFNSANDVIQYENQEDGKIVIKGNIKVNPTGFGMNGTIHETQAGNIKFTIEIGTKDTKCRIRIYDISHEAKSSGGKIDNAKPDCGGMGMTLKTWSSIQKLCLEKMNTIIADYESKMTQKKSNDDW